MVLQGDLPAEESKRLFILKTMLAGGIAGSVAKTAIAPMDRVKIHFQVKHPSFSPFIGTALWVPSRIVEFVSLFLGQITGVFKAIGVTYRRNGFTELYRGHMATLARVFPYAAINFMVYEQMKIRFGITKGKDVASWKRILAGSISGCAAVTATYPFDLLRARIAFVASHEVASRPSGFYRIELGRLWSEGRKMSGWGIAGLYQGYIPTMIGVVPYAGTSFYTFESLKNWYARRSHSEEIPQLTRLAFGMFAGVCAQTITYPLDVVRRRSQLWRAAFHLPPSDTNSPSDTLRLMRDMVRKDGIRELFVGLSINYLKVAPSMGIAFVIYDNLKDHLVKM